MAGSKNSKLVAEAAGDPKVRTVAASAAVAAGGALAVGKLVRDRMVERAESRRLRRYRLQPGEGAAEGVRRIARGQIDLAVERLESADGDGLDEAIHEARKGFKRLRALVRLARDGLGDEIYRHENETFRDAGRALSGVRDARVMVDTLEDLTSRYGDEIPAGGFAGLHDALTAEAQAAHEQVNNDAAAVRRVLVTLQAARARVESWPLPEDAGLQPLAPGFERIYRRGRRAQRAAAEEASTEALHELRKRAKDLWHAAQLMRPARPKRLKKLGRRAHQLSDLLGDDHDLAVLSDYVKHHPQCFEDRHDQAALVAVIERRRELLQGEALSLGSSLYKQSPKKFTRSLSRRWRKRVGKPRQLAAAV
jgi:CHAD domain-containing protein